MSVWDSSLNLSLSLLIPFMADQSPVMTSLKEIFIYVTKFLIFGIYFSLEFQCFFLYYFFICCMFFSIRALKILITTK